MNRKKITPKKEVKEKKKPVALYYANGANYSFSCIVTNKDGEKEMQTVPATGLPMYLNGSPVFLEKSYDFQSVNTKPETSYCIFAVTEEMDEKAPWIRERIEFLAQTTDNKTVYTEESWMKKTNLPQYNEKVRREAIEKDLSNATAKAKTLEEKLSDITESIKSGSAIEDLQKKLKLIEAK